MTATAKRYDTTPQQTSAMRKGVGEYLMGGSGFSQIAAQPGYVPNAVNVGVAGPVSTQFNAGQGLSRGMVRDVADQFGSPQVGSRVSDQFSPGAGPQMVQSQFGAQQVQGSGFGPTISAPERARDVNGMMTQSVDQLGGAQSPFFQNMMRQLSPAFDQRRQLALAAAREGAGNLTGSGFANALGGAVNRSLGDEQAALAQYAAQGMGLEQQRQQADASRMLQAEGMNQAADRDFMNQMLQYGQLGLTGQELGLRGQMANQAAGLQASELGLRGQMANQQAGLQGGQQGLQAQELRLRAQQAQDAAAQADAQRQMQALEMGQRGAISNQAQDANFLQQLLTQNRLGLDAQELGLRGEIANQGAFRDAENLRAQLEAQRQSQIGNLDWQQRNENAQRYAQLLGQQASLGAGPDTIQTTGGIEQLLGPLGAGLGAGAGQGLAGLLGRIFNGGQQSTVVGGQENPLSFLPGYAGGGYGTGGWAGGVNPGIIGRGGLQMPGALGPLVNRIPGGINTTGRGSLLNPSAVGGAIGGKLIGGALGGPLGAVAGSLLSKPLGKATKKVGKFLKKIF